MAIPNPGVGAWYRLNGGEPFEIVALDDDDGTIEVQYADGTLEELDREDWSDSADVEADEGHSRFEHGGDKGDIRAGSLDDIDLFDAG